VLDGGVRLVTERIPYALSASIGVWIGTGARHEAPSEAGISHFTEHVLFKGTRRRSAREIALALESVGGYLDAFTGRESTCYYAHVLPEHLPRAVDVLSDLLRNGLIRGDHVRRERNVILEEIKTFEDTPDELIHDLFAAEVWRGHPLGNPILGSPRSVRAFLPASVRGYFARRYTAERVVVAAAGALDPAALRRLVEARFRFAAGAAPDAPPARPAAAPALKVVRRDLAQEYLCLGVEGISFADRQRYALLLLNAILGGGMSSRLFQRIREERGLAYSVYSYADFCADSGLFGTFAATVPDKAETVVDLVLREYRRVLRDGVTGAELSAAKRQLRGSLVFSLESVGSRMTKLAKAELYGQEFLPVPEILARFERTTRAAVMQVAERLLDPARQTLVALGPTPARRLARAFPVA
jgi:predicted Zn-dependent peptidase